MVAMHDVAAIISPTRVLPGMVDYSCTSWTLLISSETFELSDHLPEVIFSHADFCHRILDGLADHVWEKSCCHAYVAYGILCEAIAGGALGQRLGFMRPSI